MKYTFFTLLNEISVTFTYRIGHPLFSLPLLRSDNTQYMLQPLILKNIYSLLRPFCLTQPISLHRCVLAKFITYFVNICYILSKSFGKSVKWSMQPFPKEQSGNGRKIYKLVLYYNYKGIKWFTCYTCSHLIPL